MHTAAHAHKGTRRYQLIWFELYREQVSLAWALSQDEQNEVSFVRA